MNIQMSHVRERSTSGGWIDFAVFDARSRSGTNNDNSRLLAELTHAARSSGLKVDQSALAFTQGSQIKFYGDKNLVSYLSNNGVSQWTHTLNV